MDYSSVGPMYGHILTCHVDYSLVGPMYGHILANILWNQFNSCREFLFIAAFLPDHFSVISWLHSYKFLYYILINNSIDPFHNWWCNFVGEKNHRKKQNNRKYPIYLICPGAHWPILSYHAPRKILKTWRECRESGEVMCLVRLFFFYRVKYKNKGQEKTF